MSMQKMWVNELDLLGSWFSTQFSTLWTCRGPCRIWEKPSRHLSHCFKMPWFGRNSIFWISSFPSSKARILLVIRSPSQCTAWPGCRVQPHAGEMEVCCALPPFSCLLKLAGSDFQRRQSLTNARWPRGTTVASGLFYLQCVIWCPQQKWGRWTSWPATSASKGSCVQHKESAEDVIQANRQRASYFKGCCFYLPRSRPACKWLCSMTVPGEGVPLALYSSQNAKCTHKIHYCAWLGNACQGQAGCTLQQPPWGSPWTLFLGPCLGRVTLRGAYSCRPATCPEKGAEMLQLSKDLDGVLVVPQHLLPNDMQDSD